MLDKVGFVWNSQEVTWQERFREAQCFRAKYGHGFIPLNFPPNPQLAIWAKCQRRQCKLYQEGKPAFITAERIQALESIGFKWHSASKSLSDDEYDEIQEYDLMLEVLSILSEK